MIKRLKQVISLFMLVLLFSGAAQTAVMADTAGNVYDDAGLLDSEETEDVNSGIDALKSKTGWEVFAVTTDNAQGKTADAYADDFYDGLTSEDSHGIALLIDMDNREVYISTYGEAIRYLTDARIEDILDEAFGYAGSAEYGQCFLTMLNGVERSYDNGIVKGQYNYDTETGKRSYYRSITLEEAFGALLLAAGAAAAVFLITLGKYRLKIGTYNYDYRSHSRVALTNKEDRLVNQTTTHHRVERQTTGSSGGGSTTRSSTHTSSSGRTHGGGGKKF